MFDALVVLPDLPLVAVLPKVKVVAAKVAGIEMAVRQARQAQLVLLEVVTPVLARRHEADRGTPARLVPGGRFVNFLPRDELAVLWLVLVMAGFERGGIVEVSVGCRVEARDGGSLGECLFDARCCEDVEARCLGRGDPYRRQSEESCGAHCV